MPANFDGRSMEACGISMMRAPTGHRETSKSGALNALSGHIARSATGWPPRQPNQPPATLDFAARNSDCGASHSLDPLILVRGPELGRIGHQATRAFFLDCGVVGGVHGVR